MRNLLNIFFSLFKSKKKIQRENDFYEGEYLIERYERLHGNYYDSSL